MTSKKKKDPTLNQQISHHLGFIAQCTIDTKKYGKLLLASPPHSRYPYLYPRDSRCAVQMLRRVAISPQEYDGRKDAFGLISSMAHFMKDVRQTHGAWGQRFSLDGQDKSIYRQEDNAAHGIAIIALYLLTAHDLKQEVDDLDGFFDALAKGVQYTIDNYYTRELNLFYSTTSVHESALEQGYTIWTNFAHLGAFKLAAKAAQDWGRDDLLEQYRAYFGPDFGRAVAELFALDQRYVRRIDAGGGADFRPDFTLLSPFYFGFLHDQKLMDASVSYLEDKLWDPELGMIMRYLPFYQDPATHVHAGNGPWLQYTAILAQYHYWRDDAKRGDEIMALLDGYKAANGALPEHLSTPKRFEEFMQREWKEGVDFRKEFAPEILKPGVSFDTILEEANNMSRSYQAAAAAKVLPQKGGKGGYIQFACPLMWSHVEFARALLIKAGDWWQPEPLDRAA
ncbi:MAG: hypothetical protein K9K66_06885 [Desulfarculaceae bacterium]|nr:hypothetical protein [Desulfarculaceae bacterium]MCF8071815.1 hypothetical protein [Desulfarculaceae bacterium]MCF8101365.1 hypothetical protein [Desulfarculaceae bacterium]MCF8117174.1 hypothetical protein [Desulfarculaceae bacterium]